MSDILPYEAGIAWHQLRHDALVQAWTAKRLVQYAISDYLTPRQLNAKRVSGVKVPDAVWIIQEQRIAVELELTAKKERKRDAAKRDMDYYLQKADEAQQKQADLEARLPALDTQIAKKISELETLEVKKRALTF